MGSLVSGIFGMDSGTKQAQAGIEAGKEYAEPVYFRPYTVTTGQGGMAYDPESNAYSTSLSMPNQYLQQQAQLGAAGLMPQYYGAVTQAPSQFGFDYSPEAFKYTTTPTAFGGTYNAPALTASYDPSAEVSRIFQQESALLEPAFAQQATNLQERLFGTGRLGLQLASQEAGGQVNPEAYGLQRAQQQTLAEVAASATQRGQAAAQQQFAAQQAMDAAARQQALDVFGAQKDIYGLGQQATAAAQAADLAAAQQGLGSELQRYNVASSMFGLNTAQQQQQIANLLGGYQGLFTTGLGYSLLENELLAQGVNAESARAAAAGMAGQIATGGYNQATQAAMNQDSSMGSFWGGLFGGIGSAMGKK